MKDRANGAILYEGPSLLDGTDIVVIVTGLTADSGNDKTGAMLQTWILLQEVDPNRAWKDGLDVSICGACIHRRISSGGLGPATSGSTRRRSQSGEPTSEVATLESPTSGSCPQSHSGAT